MNNSQFPRFEHIHWFVGTTDQGIDVVCATISLFHEVHEWNRHNIPKYKEVYLKAPIEVLVERDQKQLYSRALRGEMKHLMGIDVEIEEPKNPDVVIVNNGSRSPDEVINDLITQVEIQ